MKLGDLLDGTRTLVPLEGVDAPAAELRARRVTAIEYDSREVGQGAVFVAVRGAHADGYRFAPQAASRGAIAVIADREAPPDWTGPLWVRTPDARVALAALAVTFYRHPSDALLLVGVTGTNGKTTSTYLLEAIFQAAGHRPGRIGTISSRVAGMERDAARTTPEAPDLQRLLREMADEGLTACAMEVSSHALALSRVEFLRFAAGLFTNLTRDHLDFHGGMEEYFTAKRRLFDTLPPGAPSVVNVDDPYGVRLVADRADVLTFALDRSADVTPSAPIALSLGGLRFEARTPRGPVSVASPLVGRPNAYNILGAIATGLALGLSLPAIAEGVSRLAHVPGRFQTVSSPGDAITVIVDYAHTDDALRNLLETARPLARGRLISVFGCGGDRDRTKRPLMGAVAARLSDLVIVTSDNPRSEDPAAIIEDVKRGLVQPGRPSVHHGQAVAPVRNTPWMAIVDRAEAITRAVDDATAGDVVVLAGKGHEKYQVIGDREIPFDDAKVASAALAVRRRRGPVVSSGGGK